MSRFDKKAVALKYNSDTDLAPVVIASGYGEVAENIIDIAEQRGIPVYRDDSAASMLCMLDIGKTIPREMYELVAAIYIQILKTASQLQGVPGGIKLPQHSPAQQPAANEHPQEQQTEL